MVFIDEYEFEESQIIGKIRFNKNNEGMQKSLRFEYEYDDKNNVIKETSMYWNQNNWYEDTETLTKYDIMGRKTETIIRFMEESGWHPSIKIIDSYSDDGEITTITYHYENSEWMLGSRILSSRNETGLVEQVIIDKWNGSEWENVLAYTYIYDDNNNLSNSIGNNMEWL